MGFYHSLSPSFSPGQPARPPPLRMVFNPSYEGLRKVKMPSEAFRGSWEGYLKPSLCFPLQGGLKGNLKPPSRAPLRVASGYPSATFTRFFAGQTQRLIFCFVY